MHYFIPLEKNITIEDMLEVLDDLNLKGCTHIKMKLSYGDPREMANTNPTRGLEIEGIKSNIHV